VLLLSAAACTRQEEPQPALAPVAASTSKTEAQVVIPDAVKGQWKAVKIAVLDKETQQETVYTVAIGGEFVVAGTAIRLQVKNFLPAFIMDGRILTSASNETRNPAVQVVVSENDTKIFAGWLFTLYPSAHAFQHPRYGFSLVDYVPAHGKKG
jgi:hypothetical protein